MSNSPEEERISEVHKRLNGEPFYIQRLGIVAFNAGIFEEFYEGVELGQDPKLLYPWLITQLRHQGIANPEELIELFEVEDVND